MVTAIPMRGRQSDALSSRILRLPAAKFTFGFVFRTRMRREMYEPRNGKRSGASRSFGDLVEGFRVLQRGQVAGFLAQDARSHRPPDDLCAARLRERRNENDPLRFEGFPQLFVDIARDLECEGRGRLDAGLEHAEDPRDLALNVVRDPDRGGFGHRAV